MKCALISWLHFPSIPRILLLNEGTVAEEREGCRVSLPGQAGCPWAHTVTSAVVHSLAQGWGTTGLRVNWLNPRALEELQPQAGP